MLASALRTPLRAVSHSPLLSPLCYSASIGTLSSAIHCRSFSITHPRRVSEQLTREEYLEKLQELEKLFKGTTVRKKPLTITIGGEEYLVRNSKAVEFDIEYEEDGDGLELEISVRIPNQSLKKVVSEYSYAIVEIEGIGEKLATKLQKAGVKTTKVLRKRCSTEEGMRELSASTGISEAQLAKFTLIADFMNIKGIGKQFSELLQMTGVRSIKELSEANADDLSVKMIALDESRTVKLTKALPAPKAIQSWIDRAKKLV